ncbi:MAG: rRNA pseudouridine synthase [Clostridia bacterium]|nr:rRNA pseudouridine synthase [Clostridia bacterium]
MERLDKFISSQSGLSRKQARDRIWRGAVTVNGKVEKLIDRKVDPEKDEILLDGHSVTYREYLYIMMNKPQGYVSASRDRDEKTVLDLLPPEFARSGLFPAGRLDKDTEGLLIITDDGEFSHKMLAPGKEVYKTYIAQLDGPVTSEQADAFRKGITLSSGEQCLPATIEDIGDNLARIRICEGKYHQVKRMCAATGRKVLALRRVSIGALQLDETLASGECRLLSEDELCKLLKNS